MINFLSIVLFFSFVFTWILMPDERSPIDYSFLLTISLIGLLNIIVFLKWMKKKLGTWINFHTFFLIGFYIVHIQIPLFAGFGIEPNNPDFIWINTNVVNYGVWLCLVGELSWMIGCKVFYLGKNKKQEAFDDKVQKIVKVGLIDNFLFALFSIFILLVGPEFFSGNYDGGQNWGPGATYIFILVRVVLYLRIIYFFSNYQYIKILNPKYTIKKYSFSNKLFLTILLIFLILFFMTGDRGPIIDIGILSIMCYSFFVKKISLKSLFFLILSGSLIMTIIGFGRSAIDQKGNILEKGYKNYLEKENVGVTDELAGSIRIVFKAINEVPNNFDYFMGVTMASDLMTAIPFGSRFFIEATGLPELFLSSTYFFTISSQGVNYTWGEGSEIIGDIYINFGTVGVLLLMFLLGYLITKFSHKAFLKRNMNYLVIFFLLTTASVYLNRSPLFGPVQLLFFGFILDKLFRLKNA